MHKNYLVTLIFSFFLLSCVTACVSVDLNLKAGPSFDDVKYQEPAEDFDETNNDDLDKLWIHKNGSSISFLSNCQAHDDPSLDSIHQSITASVENTSVLHSNPFRYNSRKALRSSLEGSVDGVQSKFDLIIFKKHNCVFVLTYTSLPSTYSQNIKDFETFVRNFHVP